MTLSSGINNNSNYVDRKPGIAPNSPDQSHIRGITPKNSQEVPKTQEQHRLMKDINEYIRLCTLLREADVLLAKSDTLKQKEHITHIKPINSHTSDTAQSPESAHETQHSARLASSYNTKPSEIRSQTPNKLNIKYKTIFKSISDKIKDDVKDVHSSGHWVRDMRAVGSMYNWRHQAAIWVPAALIAVAAIVTAATISGATMGIAVPVVLGIAALSIPIIGNHIRSCAWSEREKAKEYYQDQLTKDIRDQKQALILSHDGTIDKNNIPESTKKHNEILKEQILLNAGMDISKEEWKFAYTSLVEDKGIHCLTPRQALMLRQVLPEFITCLRNKLHINKQNTIADCDNLELIELKKTILNENDNFDIKGGTHFSKEAPNLKKITYLEPLELSHEEYHELLRAFNEKRRPDINCKILDTYDIKNIISVKKVKDTTGADSENAFKYRVYATAQIDLFDGNNKAIENDSTAASAIEKQIKRALIARSETSAAGHGLDSLYGLIQNTGDKSSVLFKEGLQESLLEDNHYLNNWAETAAESKADHQSGDIGKKLLNLDNLAQMASNENDWLLLEKTGSRDPSSAGGKKPLYLNGIRYHMNNHNRFQKLIAEKNCKEMHKNSSDYAVNLPFKDKLSFSSTHCAPFHSHNFLQEMNDQNLIKYEGINEKKSSRQGIIKWNQDSKEKMSHFYCQHSLNENTAKNSKEKASFGPTETNNSKSIANSIKRYNSSRDIQIMQAALFKVDMSSKSLDLFSEINPSAVNDVSQETQWNQSVTLRDMGHAMNVNTLHNEMRRLEIYIHDLHNELSTYSNQKNASSVRQIDTDSKKFKHIDFMDILPAQKKIKSLTAQVADQMHNLFKTQIDYEIAYAHNKLNGGIQSFTSAQHEEMQALFHSIKALTQNSDLKTVFNNTHKAIDFHRSRLGSLNPLNGFRGRARMPFLRSLTFKRTMRNLLGDSIPSGLDTLNRAYKEVINKRFEFEDVLWKNQKSQNNTTRTDTFSDLGYIEGIVL